MQSLEINARPLAPGVLLLHHARDETEQPISLCVALPPETDIDDTRLGSHWAAKTLRALRENNLASGFLTDCDKWRIYYKDALNPYETFIEFDMTWILSDYSNTDCLFFQHINKAANFVRNAAGECQLYNWHKEFKEHVEYIQK